MNTRYEIQTFTLCGGWTNTWFIIEEDNTETPETFASEAEAQQASMNSSAKFRKKLTLGNSHRTQATASMTSASFPYHHEKSVTRSLPLLCHMSIAVLRADGFSCCWPPHIPPAGGYRPSSHRALLSMTLFGSP